MGDTNLTFTLKQYKFFLESRIEEVNRVKAKGVSSAASKHVNLDAGYESCFEDGSSKEPNVARGRRKKKSKKDSVLVELDETIKNAITNIAAQENQGPTMAECHEKLKSMRHTRGFMAPCRNVRYWLGDFRRKRAMSSKEKLNHAHTKLQNVIECALGVLKARFPILKSMPKFLLVKQRDITIACFAIHNFIRKEGLSDDFFAQCDQSDIHVNENVRDDNDGDIEVTQPIGSEADQQYMINLRDDIATQIMQARS
nr:putative harbinger transposase-derived nuclease domain-containing protein [Tanacetum cinerariifolium]